MKKFLLSISAVLAIGALNAQSTYVYTDINPDVVLTTAAGQQVNLDFDGDAVTDASFSALQVSYMGTTYNFTALLCGTSSDQNAVIGTVSGTGAVSATAIPAGTVIGSDETLFPSGTSWVDTVEAGGTQYTQAISGSTGSVLAGAAWATGSDVYAAFRFIKGVNTYYGWVLVNLSSDGMTETIKGFAYNSTPGASIVAGSTSNLGFVDNNAVASVNAFPNPASSVLNITSDEAVKSITVTTMDGKVVATSATSSVNVGELTSGVYFYEVVTESGKVARNNFVKN